MKVDIRMVLKDYDGKPLTHTEQDGEEEKEVAGKTVKVPKVKQVPTDLKYVFMIAATNFLPDEILTAEQKAKLHEIATKCVISKEPNITENEATIIKERVDKLWTNSVVLYGRICDVLDGKLDSVPSEKPEPHEAPKKQAN